jgi:hypothetical protein
MNTEQPRSDPIDEDFIDGRIRPDSGCEQPPATDGSIIIAREWAGRWCREVETEGPPLSSEEFELLVEHIKSAIEHGRPPATDDKQWTVESVNEIFWKTGIGGIVDAHNAALTTERENVARLEQQLLATQTDAEQLDLSDALEKGNLPNMQKDQHPHQQQPEHHADSNPRVKD